MNKSLEIYLNDHLAGAVGAIEVARRCIEENAGTALGELLNRIVTEIEEDRRSLEDLMQRTGALRNPFKQAGAWLTEKMSRLKLSAEDRALSNLISLETLSLGVEGKRCLWRSLQRVAASSETFSGIDFETLIARAESQRDDLERERLALAVDALSFSAAV